MPSKVLLVGSGITSALTSNFLRKRMKNSLYLEVWDKAKGVGGRMSTSISPTDDSCKVDLGAQFISLTPEQFMKHDEVYESLISHGLLLPSTANVEGMKVFASGKKHFVAPEGMDSVVYHFFQCDIIRFEHHVTDISTRSDKVAVKTKEGAKGIFDAVILTMPVPQILQATSGLSLNSDVEENLKRVKYCSRYALGLFYGRPSTAFNVPWDAKILEDDDVFQFVAFDNRKRNRKAEPDACVFHSSAPFGCDNIDCSVVKVKDKLLEHVRNIFPNWPDPHCVKCQKWRYSQVIQPYNYKPGHVILMNKPLIVAGGDGFTESSFSGCVCSALKLAQVVADKLGY